MTVRNLLAFFALAPLAACGAATSSQTQPTLIGPPPVRATTGIDRVMGRDARQLVATFGPAVQDVREGTARKLQFSGSACVLDAYLYPPAQGREPVVTFISARVPDGRDADKASCVASLARR